MYRVSYYFGGGTGVAMKEYPDFHSAIEFCMKLKKSGLIKTEYKIDKPIYDYRYLNYDKLY